MSPMTSFTDKQNTYPNLGVQRVFVVKYCLLINDELGKLGMPP